MASVAGAKSVGKTFSNEMIYEKVIYDFAADGGAVGALTLFTAASACVVAYFHAVVKTACTSGGAATVIAGVTGDTDAFMTTVSGAVANLTLAALLQPIVVLTEGTPNTAAFPLPRAMAAADVLSMTIGTAALTAGKIEFTIGYMRN